LKRSTLPYNYFISNAKSGKLTWPNISPNQLE
jgi:hypothetical protein